jgi:hypothetical protein
MVLRSAMTRIVVLSSGAQMRVPLRSRTVPAIDSQL